MELSIIPLQLALEPTIVLGIIAIVLSLIGYKGLKSYLTIEHQKTTSDDRNRYENTILNLKKELVEVEGSRRNYKAKITAMRNSYDLDYDDDELMDLLTGDAKEEEKLIPAIASAMFPKLPKSVKEILGRDEIESGIFKAIEKNPGMLGDWISKFIPKNDAAESSSTTQVLKEKYM